MRLPRPRIRLPKSRFLRWVVLPLIGAVIVAVLVVGIDYELTRPSNSYNPQVAFTAPTQTTPTKKPVKKPKKTKRHHKAVNNFSWPLYGYNLARTRDFSAGGRGLRPPFRVAWRHGHNALLEFSPSIRGNYLYYMDDSASVKKLSLKTGHLAWTRHLGTLAAATPALDYHDHLLFVPTLSDTGHTPGNGRFAALSMLNGEVKWSMPLASGSESSPLYSKGIVYFGTQAGAVYAVHARTGKVKWSFQASGDVKGGPALANGLIYFGDYGGHVYALHANSGRLAWESGTGSGGLLGSGTFYATPAVAFGRVYIGNTNGFMYSFDAHNGDLAWSRGTGAYVYAGAAVSDVPHLGPTVFVGSYNGYFYALNAQTGAIRWDHDDGGRISGASTIVGNIVYYADLDRHSTGLNVRTGRPVFSFPAGSYTPVIATPHAIYFDGDYMLYKLVHKGRGHHRRAHHKHTHRRHAKKH